MKFQARALLPLFATAALAISGNSHAVTAVNNNDNMLVTMSPEDSLVIIASYFSYAGTCLDGDGNNGYWTAVLTYDEGDAEPLELDRFCDVNNVRVAGLSGDNIISINDVYIRGMMDIRGGGDDDRVHFRGYNHFSGLSVALKGGDNVIAADLEEFLGLFPASDSVYVSFHVDIDTNGGNDEVNFKSLNAGGMVDIDVGSGDDKAVVRAGSSANKLFMRLGPGEDIGTIKNTDGHLIQMFGGGQNDKMNLKNINATQTVTAVAGGGDDKVVVKNIASAFTATANGGAGTDTLVDQGGWMGDEISFP